MPRRTSGHLPDVSMRLELSNPKFAGEHAESAFVTAAMGRGLMVSRPFGESASYDAIVDNRWLKGGRGHLWRVQVRSVSGAPPFRVTTFHGRRKRPITIDDADFLAVFIVPLAAWYVIPVRAFAPAMGLWLFPHVASSKGRFEHYREAWQQLL